MDIEKLKKIGKNVETKKVRSNLGPKVLAIVKSNTKNGESVTQKQVADTLGKQVGREIRPQHVRSILLTLRKQGKVIRLISPESDTNGNTNFWFTPK